MEPTVTISLSEYNRLTNKNKKEELPGAMALENANINEVQKFIINFEPVIKKLTIDDKTYGYFIAITPFKNMTKVLFSNN